MGAVVSTDNKWKDDVFPTGAELCDEYSSYHFLWLLRNKSQGGVLFEEVAGALAVSQSGSDQLWESEADNKQQIWIPGSNITDKKKTPTKHREIISESKCI